MGTGEGAVFEEWACEVECGECGGTVTGRLDIYTWFSSLLVGTTLVHVAVVGSQ